MKTEKLVITAISFMLGALGSSCAGEETAPGQPAVAAEVAEPAAAPVRATTVSKIVFVDQKDACECTRERADGSWAALQSALDGRADITVERIYNDTEPKRVAPYREMRAFMVIPAVYVLDGSGALLDRLQGEITAERFTKALKG